MRINCRWRTSFIMQWKMLLAPSRLMNPNWQGLRHQEIPDSPVKQVFHSHTYRERQGSLLEQRPFTRSQCGQYYKLSSHSRLRCLNTEGWHRKVALFTHTVSDSKPRVPHSHPVAFWDSELPEHRGAFLHSCDLRFMETRNVGTPFFSFSLVPSEVGMCLEVEGII